MIRYSGPLDTSQVLAGMKASLRNAQELLEECKLLIDNARYARAVALALIAMEEMGKLPMLAGSSRYGSDDANWNKHFWKRFRDHREKAYMQDFAFPTSTVQADLDTQYKDFLGPWSKFTNLREAAQYTDFEGGRFLVPSAREGMKDVACALSRSFRRA